MSSSKKKLTCNRTFGQVFIRVYRLEIHSVMLVLSTQLCKLLHLSPSFKVPVHVNFFGWRHFAVLPVSLTFYVTTPRKQLTNLCQQRANKCRQIFSYMPVFKEGRQIALLSIKLINLWPSLWFSLAPEGEYAFVMMLGQSIFVFASAFYI